MKLLAAALSTMLVLLSGAPAFAADGQSGYRSAKANQAAQQRARHKKVARSEPARYGGCGLRDHGAPLGSFSDPCNAEEFWRRMQERATSPN